MLPTAMIYDYAAHLRSGFLRRFSHGARFKLSARLVAQHSPNGGKVLDYGSGDGYFVDLLTDLGFAAVGYDPLPLIRGHNVRQSLEGLGGFDCITCLEVLEHIPDEQIAAFLSDVRRLLKPDGVLIISVPVMIGPVVIPKALPDVLRGKMRNFGYTLHGLMQAVFGKPPSPRRLTSYGNYLHMGFDHRRLRPMIEAAFGACQERTSPFSFLPAWANSQVFFITRL